MNEQVKGHCKHGEFILAEGCPQCIAESQAKTEAPVVDIVKFRYYSTTSGHASDREYSYYTVDPLEIGNFVQVPVVDRVQLAIVSQVHVPESEIESFKDRMKTIPSGSRRPDPEVAAVERMTASMDPYNSQWPQDEPEDEVEGAPGPKAKLNLLPDASEEAREVAAALEDITGGQVEVQEERQLDPLSQPESPLLRGDPPPFPLPEEARTAEILIAPEADAAVLAIYAEGEKALEYAKNRILETNADLKPANDDLVAILNLKEAMEAKRLSFVRPIRAYLDAVNDAFKRLMAPFLEADRITRAKVKEFRDIEAQKVALQQREAAAKAGATTIERQAPVPEMTRTDLGTMGGRTVWHFEIEDFALVPDEYKLPNESKIMAHARTTKGKTPIPGIKIWSDKDVTVRRRGQG